VDAREADPCGELVLSGTPAVALIINRRPERMWTSAAIPATVTIYQNAMGLQKQVLANDPRAVTPGERDAGISSEDLLGELEGVPPRTARRSGRGRTDRRPLGHRPAQQRAGSRPLLPPSR
jgi:hypothetical protein